MSCKCQCRHICRWLKSTENFPLNGKEYHSMGVFIDIYKNNTYGFSEYVDINFLVEEQSFMEYLINLLSPKVARQIFDLLSKCHCCERHQTKKPESFNPQSPSIPVKQFNNLYI